MCSGRWHLFGASAAILLGAVRCYIVRCLDSNSVLWECSCSGLPVLFRGLGSGLIPGECSERLAVFRERAFLGFSCIQRIRLGLERR